MTLPSGTPPGSSAANHPYEKLRSGVRRPYSELTVFHQKFWSRATAQKCAQYTVYLLYYFWLLYTPCFTLGSIMWKNAPERY